MTKNIKMSVSLAIMVIGLYMMLNSSWPEFESLTGLAILLTGFMHWMPFCPVCKTVFKN